MPSLGLRHIAGSYDVKDAVVLPIQNHQEIASGVRLSKHLVTLSAPTFFEPRIIPQHLLDLCWLDVMVSDVLKVVLIPYHILDIHYTPLVGLLECRWASNSFTLATCIVLSKLTKGNHSIRVTTHPLFLLHFATARDIIGANYRR